MSGSDVMDVFDVNVAGVVRTITAFVPLLRRSTDPVIINVSSGMGSLDATHDPSRVESRVIAPIYTSSKAALTMLTTQYAKAFPDIRINAADPVYTATDLNGHSGPQTVSEGTDAIVALATEGPGHGRDGSSIVTVKSRGRDRPGRKKPQGAANDHVTARRANSAARLWKSSSTAFPSTASASVSVIPRKPATWPRSEFGCGAAIFTIPKA